VALQFQVPVEGIRARCFTLEGGPYLLIESGHPLRTLNSAPWGGGFGTHRVLINRQVHKAYRCDDPLAEMNDFLTARGYEPSEAACMLTAAKVEDAGFSAMALGVQVCTWVTVGLGNKARAGMDLPRSALFPGTINIIALIDGCLTDEAMVNAVITATEAKAAALQDLGVRVGDTGPLATGTTTDAVLIAATQRGLACRYAGTATELGYLIGRTVYEAAVQSGRKYKP
jgi:adenosylcobinamide hydrolase